MSHRLSPFRVSSRVSRAAICVLAAFALWLANAGTARADGTQAHDPARKVVAKKGFGLAERRGFGVDQLKALNVDWYYNWNSHTELETTAQFVPMIFSPKRLDSEVKGNIVLGYNEPDHPKQANVAVKPALEQWPKVAAKAKLVGSPAMAGNAITGDWLPAFMREKPRVDFICVHWYGGADPAKFIHYIEEIHHTYHLPIWVTEYAPQTAASSKESPAKFSQAQVDKFVAETVQWMEKTEYVHRYAWHDSREGTSALFEADGHLTATGKAYAKAR